MGFDFCYNLFLRIFRTGTGISGPLNYQNGTVPNRTLGKDQNDETLKVHLKYFLITIILYRVFEGFF